MSRAVPQLSCSFYKTKWIASVCARDSILSQFFFNDVQICSRGLIGHFTSGAIHWVMSSTYDLYVKRVGRNGWNDTGKPESLIECCWPTARNDVLSEVIFIPDALDGPRAPFTLKMHISTRAVEHGAFKNTTLLQETVPCFLHFAQS